MNKSFIIKLIAFSSILIIGVTSSYFYPEITNNVLAITGLSGMIIGIIWIIYYEDKYDLINELNRRAKQ